MVWYRAGGVLIMKKIHIVLALFLLMFLSSSTIYAYEVKNQMPWNLVQKKLKLMEGNWYNDDGKLILTVKGDYINGCEVMSAFDFAGASNFATGVFHIRESKGMRQMRIGWKIYGENNDYITVDRKQMLHRTMDYYYESVGGVHLGMSIKNLEKIWGKPSSIQSRGSGNQAWYYDDKKISISFDANCISGITLYKGCKLKFEKSGLNCQNSPQEFRRVYQWQSLPSWKNEFMYFNTGHRINHGEYIFLKNNMESVTLSVFFN